MNKKISIEEIQNILQYKFKNKKNLINCLTHPSFYKESNKNKNNIVNEFERLEFLGDRVLGLTISYLIFQKFDNFDEGSLTKKFSYLVQKDFLYKIALELNLGLFLKFGKQKINYKMNKSILSDSIESLIGAIFIDGGYKAASKFIIKTWSPYLFITESNETDPKTKLQEISQKKYKILPEYQLIKKTGPPHYPTFTVSLKVLNMKKIICSGKSIREAEKKAAIKILKLTNDQKIN
jgi:ribonuclease-3